MTGIKAVCFDFDGTLARFEGDFNAFVDALAGRLGDNDTYAPAAFRGALLEELKADGQLTLTVALSRALTRLSVSAPAGLEDLAMEAAHSYAQGVELAQCALESLEACRRRGLRLALVSNGPADMQRAAIERVGIERYFRCILVSGDPDVAARKPHPRIFDLALAGLETVPEQALMVGDNYDADIAGAAVLGMPGLLIGAARRGVESMPNLEPFPNWLEQRV